MKILKPSQQLFSVYSFGTIILFLGLLWMFLPHTAHSSIISEAEEINHYVHIFQGVILAIAGLGFMMLSNKYRGL